MRGDRCETRIIHQEKVDRVRGREPEASYFKKLAALYKVLGEVNRLRILHALMQEEMCVCDLAALLEVSESAVSHQLRQLRSLDLVENRREGTILYYRLADPDLTRLVTAGKEFI